MAIIPEFWLSTLKFEIKKAETQFKKTVRSKLENAF